jgi:hypothetical protein
MIVITDAARAKCGLFSAKVSSLPNLIKRCHSEAPQAQRSLLFPGSIGAAGKKQVPRRLAPIRNDSSE